MGVPISFLGAVMFFAPFDVNINMISLFGLIIVLGLVVDDAVVVGENIISEQESGGQDHASTLRGVRGVFSPVTVGVLTTMAAFAPLLFVTGTFGQILGSVPIVVILVLTMSLIEVFLILPAHLSHGQAWSRGALKTFQDAVARRVTLFRDGYLVPSVEKAVRHSYLTLLAGIGMLVLAGALIQRFGTFYFFSRIRIQQHPRDSRVPCWHTFQYHQGCGAIVNAAYTVNENVGGASFKAVSHHWRPFPNRRWPWWRRSTTTASNLASVEIQLPQNLSGLCQPNNLKNSGAPRLVQLLGSSDCPLLLTSLAVARMLNLN